MFRIVATALIVASLAPSAHAGEVLNRERNQQARIAQGIRSGQLNQAEINHLERREANINARRNADLAANGGHLTARNYRDLNAREDSVSGQIYVDKHNAQRSGVPYYIR